MKKVLLILLLLFISINIYAQKITATKSFYDCYNSKYVKTKVVNTSYKTIVCIVFEIEYRNSSMWDMPHYREISIKTNINPQTYRIITYYPPEDEFETKYQYLKRIIFKDGTYKEY